MNKIFTWLVLISFLCQTTYGQVGSGGWFGVRFRTLGDADQETEPATDYVWVYDETLELWVPEELDADQISIDTTEFDLNLDDTITDVQLLADAVDEIGIGLEDEGADQGTIYTLDFQGAGVDASQSGITGEIVIPGVPSGDVTSWKLPVIDKDLTAPPGAPSDGDRYIIGAGVAGDWYSAGGTWKYRQKITIDKDKVPSNQTYFPATVIIDSATNDIFGHAISDGYDILFTSSDKTTKLDHELEYYDDSVGSKYAELHVRIPTLSSSADTDIYMYYGNAAVGSDPSLASTWDANFLFVQHLSDLTTSTTKDSVTAANNMTKGAVNNPLEVDGKIGKVQSCDGINDYIKTANNFLSGPSEITVSGWIKKESGGHTYETALHKGSANTIGSSDYWLGVDISDYLCVTIGGNQVGWAAGKTSTIAVYGTWYHLAAVWDGSDVDVYLDGAFNKTYALGSYGDLNADTRIGSSADGTNYMFKGEVDEIRISDSVRSADWIATQYNNQNSPSTFMSFAGEEAPSASGDWAGYETYITEWNDGTSTWDMTGPPQDGWGAWVSDEDKVYYFNGSSWTAAELNVDHQQTLNLQGGNETQRYHMTEAEHTAATRDATNALNGLMPSGKMTSWDSAWHVGETVTEELQIELDKPAIRFHDTDDNSAYKLVHDAGDGSYPYLSLYRGSVSEGTFTASPAEPLLYWDSNNDLSVQGGKVAIGLLEPKTTLTIEGPLTIKEQAAADADTAGYGQIWVKTATPNELWFTDDTGTDVQLGAGVGEWTDEGSYLRPTDGDEYVAASDTGSRDYVDGDGDIYAEDELEVDGLAYFGSDIYILGDDIFATTNTDRYVWIGDGTNYNPEVLDLGTDTTGNYVASVTDGDNGIDGSCSSEGCAYAPSFDGTEIDAITWSDNANASNIWTFDVSGTDTTMTAGNGLMTFSHEVAVNSLVVNNTAEPGISISMTNISGTDNQAIDIIGGEALATTEHWTGIRIKPDDLDPSGIDARIRGLAVNMSGVDMTNSPDIEAVRVIMPPTVDQWAFYTNGIYRAVFDATGWGVGDHVNMIQMTADITGSSGGTGHFIDCNLVGTGSATGSIIGTSTAIDIIHQHTGTFETQAKAWKRSGAAWTDATTAFGSAGTDVEIFSADDDWIYISGNAASDKFDVVEVVLDTEANVSIQPVFEYWNGAWVTLPGVNDGTGGFKNTGTITWDLDNISDWAQSNENSEGTNRYWMRIQRTRNNLVTKPIEDTIKVLVSVEYYWDNVGDVSIRDLIANGSDVTIGLAGVKLTGDGDGALTILGLGDGADEDITLNLDDTADTISITSSTGVSTIDWFDQDMKSLAGLYGIDDGVFINLGTNSQVIISSDGAGSPFSTPDLDFTGTSYFDDDMGLLLDKKIMFGDANVFISSDDDGYFDIDADTGIRLNARTGFNMNPSVAWLNFDDDGDEELVFIDLDLASGATVHTFSDPVQWLENWVLVDTDNYTETAHDVDIDFDFSDIDGLGETATVNYNWLDIEFTDVDPTGPGFATFNLKGIDIDLNTSALTALAGYFLDFQVRSSSVFTVDVSGSIDASGSATIGGSGVSEINGGLKVDGGAFTFNDDSEDYDFRAESNSYANMLKLDAGNNTVGIGTATEGAIASFGNTGVTFNEDSQDRDFRVESNG
ncbi:MAG: hypothetical protein DRP08_02550, partial [Candidatus Aenigmatarchaeota archaeon]